MTNEQIEIAKVYYQRKHPGKKFEDLRLYRMNQVLAEALAERMGLISGAVLPSGKAGGC